MNPFSAGGCHQKPLIGICRQACASLLKETELGRVIIAEKQRNATQSHSRSTNHAAHVHAEYKNNSDREVSSANEIIGSRYQDKDPGGRERGQHRDNRHRHRSRERRGDRKTRSDQPRRKSERKSRQGLEDRRRTHHSRCRVENTNERRITVGRAGKDRAGGPAIVKFAKVRPYNIDSPDYVLDCSCTPHTPIRSRARFPAYLLFFCLR